MNAEDASNDEHQLINSSSQTHLLVEVNLHKLPEAAAVVVAHSFGVSKGLQQRVGCVRRGGGGGGGERLSRVMRTNSDRRQRDSPSTHLLTFHYPLVDVLPRPVGGCQVSEGDIHINAL